MRKHYKGLQLPSWPEVDRIYWEAALVPPLSVLDEANIASSWRPATQTTVRNGYSLALGWLLRQGLLDGEISPAARWTDCVVTAYAQDLAEHLRSKSQHSYLLNLERGLAVVEPKSDRTFLQKVIKSISVRSPHADKRARLQDPAALEYLGHQLMALERNGAGRDRRQTGVIFRDGLQIALLARRPIRRLNFSTIEIGRHLVQDRTGWMLQFAAEETKNHTPLNVSIPYDLVANLEEYLEVYRPRLMRDRYHGPRLWIARGGEPQAAHSLQLAIVKRTKEAFGEPVNPHLFRDCAATAVAIDDAENIQVAPHVLGHNVYASMERNYNLSKSIDASRKVNELVAEIRRKGRQLKRASRRRIQRDREI